MTGVQAVLDNALMRKQKRKSTRRLALAAVQKRCVDAGVCMLLTALQAGCEIHTR